MAETTIKAENLFGNNFRLLACIVDAFGLGDVLNSAGVQVSEDH
jgi:hypothetical protein